SMRSVWLRNSLRGAIGLALAVLVGQLADLQNSFWIVLGTMSVLRSSALSTSATIASALLGTLAGIVVGGLIVVAVGGDRGVLWAVLPFAVLLGGSVCESQTGIPRTDERPAVRVSLQRRSAPPPPARSR